MAQKSSFGVSTLFAAAAGAVAGAVGVFLSDKDNRRKVVREARKIEKVIEKDLAKAGKTAKRATKKLRSSAKKITKRKSR